MVVGLEHFTNYFSSDQEQYVLIGGSACYAHFEDVGLSFRATHDLDVVLCVETLSKSFSDKFKEYISQGKYEVTQRSIDSRKCFYRFQKPQSPEFPKMIELFSRRGDFLEDRYPTAAPLSIEESAESLSALLLDDDYYTFIMENKVLIGDLSIASDICLIALKVRAWLDFCQRRDFEGVVGQSSAIKKHKLDVFRLAHLLSSAPGQSVSIPSVVSEDIMSFLIAMEKEEVDLREIGGSKEALLLLIVHHFGLETPVFLRKD